MTKYLRICVSACMRGDYKIHSREVCVGSVTEYVCLYVVGDADVHEKFTILKDDNILISLGLQVYFCCSSIFGCMSKVACGESLSE